MMATEIATSRMALLALSPMILVPFSIVSVEPLDDDTKLVGRFVSVGQKTLRAKFAKLERRIAESKAAEATERRGPHALPNYAIRVADDFHRFYHHHRVLDSNAQAFRLGLCSATRAVIARCLDLVGVEAPERM